ncbi:hypothetical protein PLESTB_001182900 [Pleodorina starrii]|uniref:Uncharacterized protein n=1 Tax=Pleodorina starrii TaxID=330485 RepID=A0A9W6BSH5_9CHLO|nr:hypothetical protein PLESTM_000258900 [Pleodorina starrii]GLC57095.1 hypothetical protein PLESTB_001182900 [Pleodorina starrii]GLC64930.1 hypothetical protein PLESTF_000223200 [Pleodorina starrii]
MAESTTATRRARRAAANNSEDSVEAEFGGDYSEASLEVIRSFGRKGAQFGEVEPWEEQAVQPPAQEECDAAVEDLKSLERSLDAVKRYKPDAKELAWIDYKRALVEEASDDEVTWLKLKAYHHGLDVLRAQDAAASAADAHALSGISQEQAASAHASELAAARDAVLLAARSLLPSSSGDEEEEDEAFTALRMASHAQAGTSAIARDLAPTIAGTSLQAPIAAAGGTIYHPDYLEEISLQRQLAQQRQQRSSAFLLGLTAAVGLSVTRWWLRRRRGAGNGAARRAAPQPQPQ